MGGGIDGDAPLDYAAFQIFPSQNRYEAFVCVNEIVEKLAPGTLDQLRPHLSKVKDLRSEGSNANFRLQLPENLSGVSWFTKSTVNRFLNIVGSPDFVNIINAVEDEVSQLEKAREFHLSLYAKGDQDHFGGGEADGCSSNNMAATIKPEVKIVSSEASKNELLRAMDLRLSALSGELIAAFNRATGAMCSAENIIDLTKFSEHFGAMNLKESLCKLLHLGHDSLAIDPVNDDKFSFTYDSRHDNLNKTGGNTHNSKSVHSVVPVLYGVSPSKVAQVERQSSTGSEQSSDPSDEDRTSVERSRTLVRSASPRRSASPMRRVQIGRSGSRRAAALTIKSLGYFPARERALSQRDAGANSSEEEGCEQPHKKTENVRRMSVKDAIHLFERKQEDKIADIQKKMSSTDISVSANRSVLRRWSSGMGESSTQCQPEIVSEDSAPMTPEKIAVTEARKSPGEEKPESGFSCGSINPIETANVEITLETQDETASQPINTRGDTLVTQGEETISRSATSVKWNQQKEAELNHMLMQMTANKPVKSRNSETKRNKNLPSEQRGGFYDHYKEKRDEKLRGENAGKRAEKEAKFKEMQHIINERKAEMASKNVNDVGKKQPLHKPQKSHRSLSQDANSKRETPKPSIAKKDSSKSTPLPAIRKSWPSTPQPRTIGTSPAKTPGRISSAGTTPNRRKPQPTPPATRPSLKMERPLQGHKHLKGAQTDISKSIKGVNEKQQRSVTKGAKTTKTKVLTASEDDTGMVRKNPTFYNKITKKSSVVPLESKSSTKKSSVVPLESKSSTKKSSVVPLESKSFTRKSLGSDIGPTTIKTKASSQSQESSENCGNVSRTPETEVVTNTPVLVSQQQEGNLVALETQDVASESETWANNHQICSDTQKTDQVTGDGDDCFKKMVECPLIAQAEEEPTISPHAWVETKEPMELPIPHRDGTSQLASSANVAPEASLSPRIRHSLSQMLQEENSEPDTVEWGNAENPPSIVYQKDAPKGLKRLLKFARKSKGDVNITGWASPSAISEGEDDAEEHKGFSKRNTDNLVRKSTLHAKNNGQRKKLLSEGHERNVAVGELISARSSANKHNAQSSFSKLQEGQTSAAATTTKATRSFFSLSAFRGGKPNETKLR